MQLLQAIWDTSRIIKIFLSNNTIPHKYLSIKKNEKKKTNQV